MASRETRKLLYDVQQAGRLVLSFTHGKALEDYSNDRMIQSAVERQFEIVGEALNQILQTDSATGAKITEGRRIVDFRNRLIHGYADISHMVVWGVIEKQLPVLLQEVGVLLEEP